MTIYLFSGIDLRKVEVLRKRNADYLQNGLKSIGIELLIPLSEGCIPLALPVYLNDRDKIRKRLLNTKFIVRSIGLNVVLRFLYQRVKNFMIMNYL